MIRTPYGHALALWLNNDLVAGHVGFVYRDILYWSAPSFDIRQRQHSPNMVLLALTLKNLKEWGLRGLDLTIGEGDLKKRFSTTRVDLPWVELHPRASSYYAQAARLEATKTLKRIAFHLGGEEAWTKRVKPTLQRATALVTTTREIGLQGVVHRAGLFGRERQFEFTTRPDQLKMAPASPGVLNENSIYDLLKRPVQVDAGARAIAAAARAYADIIKAGGAFYTLLVDDRLVGWTYSQSQDSAVVLTEVYVLPEFRNRQLDRFLLTAVAQRAFGSGAERVRVIIPAEDKGIRRAAEAVGFSIQRD